MSDNVGKTETVVTAVQYTCFIELNCYLSNLFQILQGTSYYKGKLVKNQVSYL